MTGQKSAQGEAGILRKSGIVIDMIDDLKYIHEKDAQDALGIAEKQWQQYLYNFGFQWDPPNTIHEVIVAGMGGSGLAAKSYRTVGNLQVPFDIVQDYDLPDRTDENTLLICSSYSGNTEETLSIFEQALGKERTYPRPMIVVIASGGRLLERAKELNLPYLQLPSGYQPRFTFGYQYRALVELFAQTPLIDEELPILEDDANWLKSQVNTWLPIIPATKNSAKQLARELMGKSPVVYAGLKLFPAAYKWKISFNENAKNVAWCNQLPEFNHNEFLGWTSHPVDKPYAVIDLRSNLEHERVRKRFEITDRLLSGKRPAAHVIDVEGDTLLRQLMWATMLGDFVSLYLALLNGLNPTPVDLIEKLKLELSK